MTGYAYKGLNGLQESLNATGVLSEDYKGTIWSWVLLAVKEAYDLGIAEQKGREQDSELVATLRGDNAELQEQLAHALLMRDNARRNSELARRDRTNAYEIIKRMRRDICQEAGCEQYTQRCSQPRADCIA